MAGAPRRTTLPSSTHPAASPRLWASESSPWRCAAKQSKASTQYTSRRTTVEVHSKEVHSPGTSRCTTSMCMHLPSARHVPCLCAGGLHPRPRADRYGRGLELGRGWRRKAGPRPREARVGPEADRRTQGATCALHRRGVRYAPLPCYAPFTVLRPLTVLHPLDMLHPLTMTPPYHATPPYQVRVVPGTDVRWRGAAQGHPLLVYEAY